MRARVVLVVFVALLIVPGMAHAKGPDQATIDGAGMKTPMPIDGVEGRSDDLATLAELAGLYPATFGQSPDPMLAAAPQEELGPKLEITWRFPHGGPTPGYLRQDLYLYAEGGPLTYTVADQSFFETERATGGWYRTPTALQSTWARFGLPERSELEAGVRSAIDAPTTSGAGADLWLWPVVAVIAGTVLCAVAVTASRVTSGRRVRIGST
jgi:hypothetical protein